MGRTALVVSLLVAAFVCGFVTAGSIERNASTVATEEPVAEETSVAAMTAAGLTFRQMLRRQPRDERWAPDVERYLAQELKAVTRELIPYATNTVVECKSSLCRVAMVVPVDRNREANALLQVLLFGEAFAPLWGPVEDGEVSGRQSPSSRSNKGSPSSSSRGFPTGIATLDAGSTNTACKAFLMSPSRVFIALGVVGASCLGRLAGGCVQDADGDDPSISTRVSAETHARRDGAGPEQPASQLCTPAPELPTEPTLFERPVFAEWADLVHRDPRGAATLRTSLVSTMIARQRRADVRGCLHDVDHSTQPSFASPYT